MAEMKNEIVVNVIARCENADEVVGAIGALVTTGVVSMNDVIKTMYNQYKEAMSYCDDEMEALDEENAELEEEIEELENTIADLENELEDIKTEMVWGNDIPAELKELLKVIL